VTNNRELLELAAKAAGLTWSKSKDITHDGLWIIKPSIQTYWSPLTDDGDALRLAVKLNIRFAGEWRGHCVALVGIQEFTEQSGGDPISATRRAITRAAAEIGKAMP
jgi:hypothetical protein